MHTNFIETKCSQKKPFTYASPRAFLYGFTLIELMVAVCIIGILSSIAYPAYTKHILKSRRSDAKTALIDLASREERFFSVNNVYSSNPVDLGYGGSATFPLAVRSSGTSYYTINVTTAGTASSTRPTSFIATATPTGNQTADSECFSYHINNLGVQSNVGPDNSSLTSASCW